MTAQTEVGGRAAWVDEQAVRAFLASHGPNGPTGDPEMTWESEIDGWGEPGSADFARSFETFLYEVQRPGGGLVLCDGIGGDYIPAVLMDITTDSSGVADCFLIRTSLRVGVEVSSGCHELHHLADGDGVQAVLDSLETVARMVSLACGTFARAAAAFCGNGPTTAAEPIPAPAAGLQPIGLLACPECGSTGLATHERGEGVCSAQISREDGDEDGETFVMHHNGHTEWEQPTSVGVQCEGVGCEWEYVGAHWAKQLVAATEQAER